MVSKNQTLLKYGLFWLLCGLYVVIIALRDVGDVEALNDTGRYVKKYIQYCSIEGYAPGSFFMTNYYKLFAWSCNFKSEHVFIILAASPFPIALLGQARWKTGTFSISIALLLSFSAIDMSLNALRQALAVSLFMLALSYRKLKGFSYILIISSAAIHLSTLIFLPIFFIIIKLNTWEKLLYSIVSIVLFGVFLSNFNLPDRLALLNFYMEIYEQPLNNLFLIYMVSPIIMIFVSKNLFGEIFNKVEIYFFVYTVGIIIFCIFLFPFIVYRIIMFATIIQLFLFINEGRPGIKARYFLLSFTLAHFAAFNLLSDDIFGLYL